MKGAIAHSTFQDYTPKTFAREDIHLMVTPEVIVINAPNA